MYVTFTTDGSGTYQGFVASYQSRGPIELCANGADEDSDGDTDCADGDCAWDEACTPIPCSGVVDRSSPTGVIQDGYGSSNYTNNMDCAWRIQVPGASSIDLSFSEFRTETGYDFVRVYQGTSTGGTLLGTFDGASLPSTVTASGSAMYVRFTSDISNTYGGFVASYSSSP